MDFSFKTIGEFNDHFNTEAKCYEYLELKWWGGVPRCPHCGNEKYYSVKSRTKFDVPTYRCSVRSCGIPYTVKTGSIFEGTKVELRKWFQAMYELVTSKKGISSVELSTRIGVSQKCAWFMNHRIREMLGVQYSDDEPMGEGGQVVEIDETYIGGKMANMTKSKRKAHKEGKTHSQMNKTTVMGYVVRSGELRLKKIKGREEVTSSMLDNVSKDAVIITDTASYYRGLQNIFPNHEMVDHSKEEYVREGVIHTNTIEGAFSILDRAIMGVFHFVSAKHLQKYCDEITLKYNGRTVSNSERFMQVVEGANVKRITYRELTK
ncbi:MAG: IS1595 family transposase [Bacteroidota bacterium]